MEKKIIQIDMDGVTCRFNEKFNELAPHIFLGEGDNYEARSKMVDEVLLANPTFFQDLEPIDGAIEAIVNLSEYYDINFLSTPVAADYNSYSGKPYWLKKYFGDLAHKKLTLTHRKDRVAGDYLIDDRTRNGAGEFKGKLLLFGGKDFPDWNSILNYLIPPTRYITYTKNKIEHVVNIHCENISMEVNTVDTYDGYDQIKVPIGYKYNNLELEFLDELHEFDFYSGIDEPFNFSITTITHSGNTQIFKVFGKVTSSYIDINQNVTKSELIIHNVIIKEW